MTALDIKPELTRETFEELVAPLRNGSVQRIVFNTVHRRKDGTLNSVESNTQLSSHGSDQFFLAIVQDTTERDKARRSTAGTGNFPDTVCHMRQQFQRMEGFNVEVVNYAKSVRKFWLSLDVQPVRGRDGVGSII